MVAEGADYRDVVVMRHFMGMEFQEVARRMNGGDDGAKAIWQRTTRKLLTVIDGEPI